MARTEAITQKPDSVYIVTSTKTYPGIIEITQACRVGYLSSDIVKNAYDMVAERNKGISVGFFSLTQDKDTGMCTLTFTQRVVSSVIQNKSKTTADMIIRDGAAHIKGFLFDLGFQKESILTINQGRESL